MHCCGLWKIQNMLKIPSWNISEPDRALKEYLWGVRKIARTTFLTGASMPSQGGPSAKAARSVKFSRFRNFKCISTQTIFIICKVEIPKGDLRLASMTQVLTIHLYIDDLNLLDEMDRIYLSLICWAPKNDISAQILKEALHKNPVMQYHWVVHNISTRTPRKRLFLHNRIINLPNLHCVIKYFQCFGFIHVKNVNSVCMYTAMIIWAGLILIRLWCVVSCTVIIHICCEVMLHTFMIKDNWPFQRVVSSCVDWGWVGCSSRPVEVSGRTSWISQNFFWK